MADEQAMSPWHEVGDRVFAEMESWRREHPKATFGEIEAAVEARLDSVRAKLIEQEIALRPRSAQKTGRADPPAPNAGS